MYRSFPLGRGLRRPHHQSSVRHRLGDLVGVVQLSPEEVRAECESRTERGEVPGRKKGSARSVNYMLYVCTAVLDDQVSQTSAVRNVAKLVDRIAGEAGEMRTLTERDMFRILDHECRDRHLWALALYGPRRGEITGLRWTNVDLKAQTVRIVENRVAVGTEIMSGTPKSKASIRTPPMG